MTDSAEIIFIINNLSNISVNKTLSKMCIQKKKSQLKRVTGDDLPVCNIFIKNNIIQNVFTKQNIPTEIFEYVRITGDFTLW